MFNWHAWRRGEGGTAEAAMAVFVLPLMVTLLFLFVDAGFAMNTRANINQIVNDTARSSGLDGGYKNVRSSMLPKSELTLTGTNSGWAHVGTTRLVNECKANRIRTKTSCASLKVTCSPAVATTVGQGVSCWLATPITYKTASPLSTSPLFSFGMSGLFTAPINAKATSVASVGSAG